MSISGQLQSIAKKMGVNFTFKGQPMAHKDVFSDAGLLPGLVKRADQLSSLCMGYKLGATIEDAEDAVLGSRVIFDSYTPDVLRLFCLTDVLYELVKTSPSKGAISLDELMYD